MEFSRPRQESEKLHHIAFVQKLKNFDLPDAESVEMMHATCDGSANVRFSSRSFRGKRFTLEAEVT